MRTRLAPFALVLALAVVGCSVPGSEVVDGEGITGTYTVNGTDAVGIEYSGTVVIEATDESDVYAIQWIITGSIQEGTGRLRGDRLEVDWRSVTEPRDGGSAGTAVYTVQSDGDLVGTRTIDGVDGVGTEEIFQEA